MKRIVPLGLFHVALLLTSTGYAQADDLKIAVLEQDVREIKQYLMQQGRRIDSLERELGRVSAGNASSSNRVSPKAPESPELWLNARNWERVLPQMAELEAIQILGAPATVRPGQTAAQRILYYAMEMGAGSFLAGQVVIESGKVVSVQKPALK